MTDQLDTIYTNARFYTVDAHRSWADAIGVRDGAIAAIGSADDVLAHASSGTQVIDLGGAVALPGLHDGHVHLLEQSLRNIRIQCQLDDPQSLDELAAQLNAYHADNPERSWIIAGIYNSQVLTSDLVTKDFLDRLFPEVPVILYDHTAVHVCLANSTALRLANITADTPNPEAGVITRDDEGQPTGWLTEAATALVRLKVPPYSEDEVDRALAYATDTCARYGITSVQEAGTYRSLLAGLKRLEQRGELKTYVFAHLVYNFAAWGGWGTANFEALRAERHTFRGELVHPDGVKVFLDGTSLPPQFTHVPLDPETGEPDARNLMVPRDEIVASIRRWTDEGLKVKMHASGMGAVRIGLDIYEQALDGAAPSAPHDLAHCRWVSEQDVPRFARIGVVGEMSPTIWQDPRFADGLDGAFRFASLRDSGAHLSLGSDWILPQTPNLFPGIGGILAWKQESLGIAEAVEMATINGATSIGMGHRFGSLEKGKDATFIVLDRDIFATTPEEIEATEVTRTVLRSTRATKADG